MTTKAAFGRIGAWRSATQLDGAFAARAEQLGYGTLWVGGSPVADLMIVEELLDATEHILVATGIVNIWQADAASVAQSFHRIEDAHPGRLVLGIGSGHREATPDRVRPLAALRSYLDVLDDEGVGPDRRLLAALGDRTLALAAERTLGAHPYFTMPEHTAHARGVMGPDALLAPELTVALGDGALAAARPFVRRYLGLSNYVAALRRSGVSDADVDGGGSEAFVDRIVANPAPADAAAGAAAHLAAGADHVAVQALGDDPLGALEQIAVELDLT